MNRVGKLLTGAAAVALVSIPAAASAQYRYSPYGYGYGVDNVIGGVAAIISALDRDRGRYGYGNGNGYGYGNGNEYEYGGRYGNFYGAAINACAQYANRYGGGVRILDVDRRSSNRYRVRGVIENGGHYGGYNRSDPYGRYGGYNRTYGGGYGPTFACTATDYGRITDFDVNGRDRW